MTGSCEEHIYAVSTECSNCLSLSWLMHLVKFPLWLFQGLIGAFDEQTKKGRFVDDSHHVTYT